MPRDALTRYVVDRIGAIQLRHNFHPELGARQISHVTDRDVIGDHRELQVLLRVASLAGIEVPVPYDPSGLDPAAHLQQRATRPRHVYFARCVNTREWKIGVSQDPPERIKQLQTGNGDSIDLLYRLEGGPRLEKLVLEYLRRYRSPGRGGREWRSPHLTDVQVRQLIERVRVEGRHFLEGRPLERSRESLT